MLYLSWRYKLPAAASCATNLVHFIVEAAFIDVFGKASCFRGHRSTHAFIETGATSTKDNECATFHISCPSKAPSPTHHRGGWQGRIPANFK